MEIEFEKIFLKDLRDLTDNSFLIYIESLVKALKSSDSLRSFKECKKLKGSDIHYRFKFRNLRIGVSFKEGKIKFIRAFHGKEIYRFFP